jgi:hypothetical protein
VPVHVVRGLDDRLRLLRAERDENTCREPFLPTEAVSIGREITAEIAAEAKKRQGRPGKARSAKLAEHDGNGEARDKVADAVGMSHGSWAKAREVVEAAEADPEAFGDLPRLMDATGTVDGAFRELRRRERRRAAEAERAARAAASPAPAPAGDAVRFFHCRFQDLERVAGLCPGSAQLFVADIPYGQAFLPQVDDLGGLAARVLVPGGLLALYSGQAHLNRVLSALDRHLSYRWTLASVWDGNGSLFHPQQALSQWKPILLYSRGEWTRRGLWPDVLRVNSKEKDLHEWQQPLEEAERLVRYFSQPGDLVVDPVCGSGTVAAACRQLGRRCVTCDTDAQALNRAKARVA